MSKDIVFLFKFYLYGTDREIRVNQGIEISMDAITTSIICIQISM